MSSSFRSCFMLSGFVLAYFAYLILGALVFSAIERPVEESLKADMSALKAEFLNLSCINASALETFLQRVLKANKYGVSVLENSTLRTNWDLASSLFFANTMVTTVGYGHTTPLSDIGKAFSIVYALFGVPFTMLVLTICVQRLMYPLTYGPIAICQRRAGLRPRGASVVHFIVLIFLVVLCFFVVPSLVFRYGHTTPLSDIGKAFSIVYALFGVPFTMLVLTICVQRLMYPLTYGPIAICQRRAGLRPRGASVVHFIVLIFLVVLCFFVVPSLVFSAIEESWSFLDAFYFCFISLCTIGLGDFVPAEKPGQSLRSLYKISVMVYLFVGLMVMFLVLRTFHKLADVHGWTAFLQLPSCEEEEDKEPIIQSEDSESNETEKTSIRPLASGSQVSYNTIHR
ncbi:hypothetical protein DNTS_027593 [Danionella cerebrum]|uniref:Potassium channel subfamily K member n=1 Tax=Danionella cerebrum TaxID=2873325 RepID=A0A553QW48_9TELE|nr:hypothetical protein DNTS_027593 [Danionella translucida]